jgi:hypothetical protein
MHPIYINSRDEHHSFDSILERLIEICNEHIRDNRAFCFCMFLYDETNASLIKAIKDEDNWNALHYISGNRLTIFSIHKKHRGSMRAHSSPAIRFQFNSHKIFSKNDLEIENQKLVEKYFSNVGDINYPSLLFFQIDRENIIDHLIVELREKKMEETFLEVKEIIDAATTGLKRVDRSNKENRRGSFNQVIGELIKLQSKYQLIRFTKRILSVKEFIDSFKEK